MDSIINANRFIATNWKELDTAFRIQRAVLSDMNRFADDTPQHKELKSMFYNLERIIVRLSAATADINRGASLRGEPILPRVAWLPEPILDEETGTTTVPPCPELPTFETKADRCHYLKQLADAALKDKQQPVAEEHNIEEHHTDRDTALEGQSLSCDASQEQQPTPAQQAIAAIRSRRKKKSTPRE